MEGVLKAQCNKCKHQLFPRPNRMKNHFKILSNFSLESMESEDNDKSSDNSDCEINEFQIDNPILTHNDDEPQQFETVNRHQSSETASTAKLVFCNRHLRAKHAEDESDSDSEI